MEDLKLKDWLPAILALIVGMYWFYGALTMW